jgi:hypothetical protein
MSPPKTLHHDSFIRRGNHFICMFNHASGDEWNWVLIDGPWYDYLTGLSGHGKRWRVDLIVPKMPNLSVRSIGSPPRFFDVETITWEAIRWHPGSLVSRARAEELMIKKGHTWLRALTIARKWEDLLRRRTRTGWRLLPDGKLPAYLNKPGYEEEMAWDMERYQPYG